MGAFTQDFIVQKTNRKKHKPAAMDVPARLWNPDGTPFAGCSSTPADGSVTNAMLAGGITADKLAAGVIPTVPKAVFEFLEWAQARGIWTDENDDEAQSLLITLITS